MARVGPHAPEIAQRLRAEGILIRDWSYDPHLKGFLRFTVGSKAQMRRLYDQLQRLEKLIDTRNGTVPGRVARIDSAVLNGTVTVDVALEGALPKGARPDLSVDGTVELERLAGVTYVSRPVAAEENATLSLFKLTASGTEAVLVQVKFGRSSVGTIELRDGLREGDRIILSDMAQWQSSKLIRLN